MARIKLKYVHSYVDRHGVARFYFRRAGFKKIPLPGLPGSNEFMTEYQKAVGNAPRIEIGAGRVASGSIGAAIAGISHRRHLEPCPTAARRCAVAFSNSSVATTAASGWSLWSGGILP
jgi:hypothetical protein